MWRKFSTVTPSSQLAKTIDLCVVEEVLKKYGGPRDLKLRHWNVFKEKTKPEDRYFNRLLFNIFYNEGNGRIESKTFLAKLNPQIGNASKIFRQNYIKDSVIPQFVLPKINKCLSDVGSDGITSPFVYFSGLDPDKEILVVEDVEALKYKEHCYSNPMDFKTASIVIKELAKLHAGSALLENSEGSIDKQFGDAFQPPSFLKDKNIQMFLNGSLQGIVESSALAMETISGHQNTTDWIRQQKQNFLRLFMTMIRPSEKFRALVHGDVISSQISFLNDQAGQPTKLCWCDFGDAKIGTPVVDLNYFMYTSLNSALRRNAMNDLLLEYFNSYEELLKNSKLNMPFTLKELNEEVRQKMLIGLYAGLTRLPAFLGREKGAPDMQNFRFDNIEQVIMDNRTKLFNLMKTNENFRTRYIEIFEDLKFFKVIQ